MMDLYDNEDLWENNRESRRFRHIWQDWEE